MTGAAHSAERRARAIALAPTAASISSGADRTLLSSLAFGRRSWLLVLDMPCRLHAAPSGRPCWDEPARGLCGDRITRAVR